ncbi:MAG: hypothetical protein J6N72_03705 [Psychrobacter sp.]|nr:hypothetical protein [Psychrobacter sp.]
MKWITHLNSSEKKQIAIIGIVLALVIGFIVFIFVNIADKQKITMDDALQTAGDADRIDRLAVELSRMGPTYNATGQEISQYEIQNPIDGGFGDDGSLDSTVAVVTQNVEEVRRINQSVDLSNGMPASAYLDGSAATQPASQPIAEPAPAEPATEITSIEPSLPASQ